MDTPTLRMLLVEDNPGDARLIREMLREAKDIVFSVQVVTTLKEALGEIGQQRWDVVLLDLSLPDSFGVDTLRHVHEATPSTPVVVLTGFDDQGQGLLAVQSGAQDYLVKGDTYGKLLSRAIQYAIERHAIELALRRSEEEYRSLINDVFDISTVAVLILDRNLRVVWVNEATEVYFGLHREEMLGQDTRLLVDSKIKCVFEDPEIFANQILYAYEHSTYTSKFECHIVPTPERKERWLEYWSQPINSGMYAGGRIEQYTDITERKRIETAERQQRILAEALRDTAALLTSSLDLKEVLDRILMNIERVVPYDVVTLMLMDGSRVVLTRGRAYSEEELDDVGFPDEVMLDDAPILNTMAQTGQPAVIADLEAIPLEGMLPADTIFRAYAGAPIPLQGRAIGFINVFSFRPHFFSGTDADRLSAFAEQAAIGIQNARLYQQSQELAALQERQRLARELHDSVTQTLFTSSVMAESTLRQWETNPAKALTLAQDVHQLIVSALAEMRILLLELRPKALVEVSLKQLFEQYLRPLQERRQIEVMVQVGDLPRVAPEAQIALYRIVQEAVNNVIKHAKASQVVIEAAYQSEPPRPQLVIKVRDNGHGFDPATRSATSMGLGIMQERAATIGASVNILSTVGRGTQVEILWPIKALGAKSL